MVELRHLLAARRPAGGRRLRRPALSLLASAGILGAAACTAGLPPPAGSPVADPTAAAAEAARATVPAPPRRVTFSWVLDESGTRVRGRGVARFEAPERLRLDLFGPRGETYLAAALVGDTFRIPPAAADRITLPSPALLWGALGVVRPPSGAQLASATESGEDLILRYEATDGEIFQYRVQRSPEAVRLQQVERLGRSGVLESIGLSYTGAGDVEQARYRDWPSFRELVLSLEESTSVPPFPTDTWSPAGAPR